MTLLAQTPSLRAGQASLRTCAQRAERPIKMQVSDCVDTALTRARQARLPSPWTEAVDFLDLAARASKTVEHWRAWLCGKQRKSTASGQGEGSGKAGRGKTQLAAQRSRVSAQSLWAKRKRVCDVRTASRASD